MIKRSAQTQWVDSVLLMRSSFQKNVLTLCVLLLTLLDLGFDVFVAQIPHCDGGAFPLAVSSRLPSELLSGDVDPHTPQSGMSHECIGCCHHVLPEGIFDPTPLFLLTTTRMPECSLTGSLWIDSSFHPPRA
jgi:hypothetical protein